MNSKPTILILDDNIDFLELIPRFLSPNFESHTFSDPDLALRVINEGFKPDAIICDYVLPKMSGADFLKNLRDMGLSNIPFIFLTGLEDPDLEKHGVPVLYKPVQKRTLLITLNDLLKSKPNHLQEVDNVA